jgi:polyisoprenoid-binding protein YceI
MCRIVVSFEHGDVLTATRCKRASDVVMHAEICVTRQDYNLSWILPLKRKGEVTCAITGAILSDDYIVI